MNNNIDIQYIEKSVFDKLYEKFEKKKKENEKYKEILQNMTNKFELLSSQLSNSKDMFNQIQEINVKVKETVILNDKLIKEKKELEKKTENLNIDINRYKLKTQETLSQLKELKDFKESKEKQIGQLKISSENYFSYEGIQVQVNNKNSSSKLNELNFRDSAQKKEYVTAISLPDKGKDNVIKKLEDLELAYSETVRNFQLLLTKFIVINEDFKNLKEENENISTKLQKVNQRLTRKIDELEVLKIDKKVIEIRLEKINEIKNCCIQGWSSCLVLLSKERSGNNNNQKGLESNQFILCEPQPSIVKFFNFAKNKGSSAIDKI